MMFNMDRLFEIEAAQQPLPESEIAAGDRPGLAFQEVQLRESEDLEADSYLVPVAID